MGVEPLYLAAGASARLATAMEGCIGHVFQHRDRLSEPKTWFRIPFLLFLTDLIYLCRLLATFVFGLLWL